MPNKFKAFLIEADGKGVKSGFVDYDVQQLDPGEVTIEVAYSSINYKDALAATGKGRIIRRFPCIAGIDLAGTVISSNSPKFKKGDQVLATSFDIGVAHHGGYAEIARLPADWVIHLPANLSLHEAMIFGTAGFTAGLAIHRMEINGLKADLGPVVVNGATGGVGSLIIAMLSNLGYKVSAISGKEQANDFLLSLGAEEIINRKQLDLSNIKALDNAKWAGAVDNLGGDMLAWLISGMKIGGTVASIGLAASMDLKTSVAPFILRGVSLLGIDSVNAEYQLRSQIWQRLANDLRPTQLNKISTLIGFDEITDYFQAFINSEITGRIVVKIN